MDAKQRAGFKAAEFVEDGMAVGRGTGSTAHWVVERLGERVRAGLRVRCVPTSRRTEEQARKLGIPLVTFGEVQRLDEGGEIGASKGAIWRGRRNHQSGFRAVPSNEARISCV